MNNRLALPRAQTFLSREAWLQARRFGLGGSDVGAVVLDHCDSYTTPTTVWESKVMPLRPESDDEDSTLERDAGNFFEPALVRWGAARVGAQTWRLSDLEVVSHPLYPLVPLQVSPDGVMEVYVPELGRSQFFGVECKRPVHFKPPPVPTAGTRPYVRVLGDESTGDALWNPDGDGRGCTVADDLKWQRYVVQCIAGMACLPELDGWVLVIDARPFPHVYVMRPSADDIAAVENRSSSWWARHVVGGAPPPPTDPDWASHDLSARIHESSSEVASLPEEAAALYEAYEVHRADEKLFASGKAAAKEKLKRLMNGAHRGATPDGTVYSFDKTKSGEYVGQLRRRKPAEKKGKKGHPAAAEADDEADFLEEGV